MYGFKCGSELYDTCAVSVDHANSEGAEVDNETLLQLVDASSQQIQPLFERHVGPMVAVESRHGKEGTVTVSGEWNSSKGAEVVDPVECGLRVGQVEAAEKQVDLVGVPGAQRLCQLLADPCSCRLWPEFDVVSVVKRRAMREAEVERGRRGSVDVSHRERPNAKLPKTLSWR